MATLNVSSVRLGRVTVDLSSTSYTLTADEQATRTIKFTGSLSSAATVTLASVEDGREWIIWNACGASLTLKASGGTGITVANNKTAILRCDDTDVRRVTADSDVT